jgi:hypothetical protein
VSVSVGISTLNEIGMAPAIKTFPVIAFLAT